tara:strand:+ start:1664 stop:1879 length:216 start_codon:yes stop_codon:yes gene_type:complete
MSYYNSIPRYTSSKMIHGQTPPEKSSVGLGDIVEKVLDVIGVNKVLKNKPCGCKKRKERLNGIRLYRKDRR